MKHMTVKFVSTNDEKFDEYIGKLIDSMGSDGKFIEGVCVEMVSKQDINQQIDDINDVVMNSSDPEDSMIEIDNILAKCYYTK